MPYLHLITRGDVRTPQTWELSNRDRPTNNYTYVVDVSCMDKLTVMKNQHGQIVATFNELKFAMPEFREVKSCQ